MAIGPHPDTYKRNPDDPKYRLALDVSSTTATFHQPTVAIYVGGTGNLAVTDKSGATVVLQDVAAGVQHRIVASSVVTGTTTATKLVAVW